MTLLPLSLVLGLLALGVGFRSPQALLIAVLGGVWSVALMLGGVALAGWTLNVVTVAGPTLMAVIVVATTVHFAHDHAGGARGSSQRLGSDPEENRFSNSREGSPGHVVR